jgi:hypothetical protein
MIKAADPKVCLFFYLAHLYTATAMVIEILHGFGVIA